MLDLVDILAATVVPLAGVPFGILVGQHGADRRHHAAADEVLGSDQLDPVALAPLFAAMAAATSGSACDLALSRGPASVVPFLLVL